MWNLKQRHRVDSLTKLWTEDTAKELVEEYQKDCRKSEGDLFYLITMEGWRDGSAEEGLALRQTAFMLNRYFDKVDVAARIGDSTFLAYEIRCRSMQEAERKAEKLAERLQNMDFFREHEEIAIRVGALWCRGAIKDYETLLNGARYASELAKDKGLHSCVIDEKMAQDIEVVPVEAQDIPTYNRESTHADIEFIAELTDTLFLCEDVSIGIEMALKQLCRYFGVGRAFVVELSSDRKFFEVTYEYDMTAPHVLNDNLRFVPAFLIEYYKEAFDKSGISVCNSVADLEKTNRIMAEREKIYGTKALMQSAVLEEGRFTGYITICDYKEERLWSQEEIDTYLMAGKIITASILHMRSLKYTERIEYRDLLTEAWNLNRFLLEAETCQPREGLKRAILTFDIKNFKEINREFGYNFGNEVLIEITNILRLFIEKEEYYARAEADTFVLFLYYPDKERLESRIRQLLSYIEHLSAKLKLTFPFICMAGICTEDDIGFVAREMIECADMVRKSIKDYHRSNYQFFDREAQKRRDREKFITSRAGKALKNREFIIYYQPQVNVRNGEYAGLEALVRWKPPGESMIMPMEFIPLFERSGFITELDLYVFEEVCREISGWIEAGKKVYPVSVNISRVHVKEKQFLKHLEDICSRYKVPVSLLNLELTESAFLNSPEVVLEAAAQIKEKGFLLSMDDFGTGFSSLSMLKDIPIDILKLDKEFFQMKMSRKEKIIVSNVIHMARELEIQVISEGIETKEHEQFLKEIGCDMAQGYLYAKPEPIEVHEARLWK